MDRPGASGAGGGPQARVCTLCVSACYYDYAYEDTYCMRTHIQTCSSWRWRRASSARMRRSRSTLGQASLLNADEKRALTRAELNIADMPGLCKPSCCRHTPPTEMRCSSNTGSPACWHTSHTSGIRRIRQAYVANRYALQLQYRQLCALRKWVGGIQGGREEARKQGRREGETQCTHKEAVS